MTKIRYLLEAALLYCLFFVFKILPVATTSNVGGWIGRNIGARLAATRKARRNLERAFPDLNAQELDQIILDMWDNLGRFMAEYAHLEEIARDYTVIEGAEYLADYISGEKSAIFIGAHLANFEVAQASMFLQLGLPIDATYRAPNNPYSHAMLNKARTLDGRLNAHAKSQAGGRSLMKAVKGGRNVGIMIDQKYNEGLSIPFFGRGAMTNPVWVQLAQKYDKDIIPVRVVRGDGVNLRVILYTPLTFKKDEAVESVMLRANVMLEDWIKDEPAQWLWLHKRWKD
ncbi:MAG: lipid A biosynthesis acyltransferase [Alphaproteobacteria bacterium]|nr:lipid A biosynthesis acyltransferase [Alphaproteobacteria bacterium]